MNSKRSAIVLAVVGGVAAATVFASLANSTTSPSPPPPWVNADGTVNMRRAPALPVVGPDGKPVLNPDGSAKTVRLFGPPTGRGTTGGESTFDAADGGTEIRTVPPRRP